MKRWERKAVNRKAQELKDPRKIYRGKRRAAILRERNRAYVQWLPGGRVIQMEARFVENTVGGEPEPYDPGWN